VALPRHRSDDDGSLGTDNMRDVIAFPKTASAADLMIDAPGAVDPKQLDELHLKVVSKFE
jgi:aspartyl-tRNA synthetase